MKRLAIYVSILSLTLLAPVEKLDVAKLEPVEVVSIYKEKETVILTTDTEAQGKGTDALSALKELKETTPGVVYLDTAQYLLVAEDALEEIEILRPELKRDIRLCIAENVELQIAAKYLKAHGDFPRLQQWKAGQKLPFLDGEKIIAKTEK